MPIWKALLDGWRLRATVVQYLFRLGNEPPSSARASRVRRAELSAKMPAIWDAFLMGNDMVVALPRSTSDGASADGATLFGHNCNCSLHESQALVRVPSRVFTCGEQVRTTHVALPQVRQTASVLASRSGWGYSHGLNEHGVAVGFTSTRTRVVDAGTGLTGADLVRLALERSATAAQAVELLIDLVGRHGPGAVADEHGHPTLLLADGREAFLLSTCGRFWALQEVREMRAQSDVSHLHQDWDRIAPGLADFAISKGWWPDDGSKLDFTTAIVGTDARGGPGLRRWGRATVTLEQNNGQFDAGMMRQLLINLSEAVAATDDDLDTGASLVARLAPTGKASLAWWCAGSPSFGIYLPITPDGELPEALTLDGEGGCELWREQRHRETLAHGSGSIAAQLRGAFANLQTRLMRDAVEYLAEANILKARRDSAGLYRLASSFMQHSVERLEEACETATNADMSLAGVYAGPHLRVAVPSS